MSYVAATRTTGGLSASSSTDAGRAKHAELLRAVQAFNQRLLAGFSADELDELQALLGKLEQNARADSELRA